MRTTEEKPAGPDFKHKQFYFDLDGNKVPSTIEDAFSFAQTIRKNASANLR